jgi:hypothetical protein
VGIADPVRSDAWLGTDGIAGHPCADHLDSQCFFGRLRVGHDDSDRNILKKPGAELSNMVSFMRFGIMVHFLNV